MAAPPGHHSQRCNLDLIAEGVDIFVKLVGNDDALDFSDYVGLGLLEAQL